MPIVDVLVPTHDRSSMLRQCLDSIRSQTLQDIVVTIGDDCSSDQTPEVAREYCSIDSRFRYVRNPRNLGQWGNVNGLLRRVTSPYVQIVHDDDWIEPELDNRLVAMLDASPSVGMAFSKSGVVQVGQQYPALLPERWPGGGVLPRQRAFQWALEGNFIPVGSVLMRVSALRGIVPLPDQFQSADWLLWLELSVANDVGLVDVPLAHYRVHGAQVSTDTFSIYMDTLKMLTFACGTPLLRGHAAELTEARFSVFRSYVLTLKEAARPRNDILTLASLYGQLSDDHRREARRVVGMALAYAALPKWLKHTLLAKGTGLRSMVKWLSGFGASRGGAV